jgi:hypothetical protein
MSWCSAHSGGRAVFEVFTKDGYYGGLMDGLGGLLDEPGRKVPELSCDLSFVELNVDPDRLRDLLKCLDGDIGVRPAPDVLEMVPQHAVVVGVRGQLQYRYKAIDR